MQQQGASAFRLQHGVLAASRLGRGCDTGGKVLEMDDVTGAAATMATQLSILAAKGTAQMVATRLQAIRQKKKTDEMSNAYEDLINELVADWA